MKHTKIGGPKTYPISVIAYLYFLSEIKWTKALIGSPINPPAIVKNMTTGTNPGPLGPSFQQPISGPSEGMYQVFSGGLFIKKTTPKIRPSTKKANKMVFSKQLM